MIYVTRHGEAEKNVVGILRGRYDDDPLTEKGRAQAHTLAHDLEDVKFDRAFSSPLCRAIETAKIVLGDEFKGEFKTDKRIRERGYGKFAGKGYKPYDGTAEFNIMASYNTKREREFKGVENFAKMKRRIWGFLNWVKRKYPFENILVACHHDVMILVHAYVEGEPEDGDYNKEIYHTPNCGIVKIDNGGNV